MGVAVVTCGLMLNAKRRQAKQRMFERALAVGRRQLLRNQEETEQEYEARVVRCAAIRGAVRITRGKGAPRYRNVELSGRRLRDLDRLPGRTDFVGFLGWYSRQVRFCAA